VVKGIEEFTPQLRPPPFGDGNILKRSHVPIEQSWADKGSLAHVTETIGSG